MKCYYELKIKYVDSNCLVGEVIVLEFSIIIFKVLHSQLNSTPLLDLLPPSPLTPHGCPLTPGVCHSLTPQNVLQ